MYIIVYQCISFKVEHRFLPRGRGAGDFMTDYLKYMFKNMIDNKFINTNKVQLQINSHSDCGYNKLD